MTSTTNGTETTLHGANLSGAELSGAELSFAIGIVKAAS